MKPTSEAGFTLIEVLVASALFVFVSLAGFDVLRHLGAGAVLLAQRASAATQLETAAGTLRSAALSSVAVWKPSSPCGDAVEFMERNAGGTSFTVYALRGTNLVRASAAGPLDPCGTALQTQTLVGDVTALRVARIAPPALPAHTDPVSGNVDGGLFKDAGISAVEIDAHAADVDGSHVLTGNDLIEVTIGAGPVETAVDLLAGNRPSAFTQVLAYACNGRCEANAPFPEIRNAEYTDCASGYDFQNTSAYYVPAAYAIVNGRVLVTAYTVTGGYTFAFAGPAPATLERVWPAALWPPSGSAPGSVADPFPVDYANSAVAARGAAGVAADLGEPAAFAAALTACADMHGDPTFHD